MLSIDQCSQTIVIIKCYLSHQTPIPENENYDEFPSLIYREAEPHKSNMLKCSYVKTGMLFIL